MPLVIDIVALLVTLVRPMADVSASPTSAAGAIDGLVSQVNFPKPDRGTQVKPPYDGESSAQQAIEAVVRSANRTTVLVSGGSKAGDEAMLTKARQSMEAGATGADLRT